jgi:hypothetical protein
MRFGNSLLPRMGILLLGRRDVIMSILGGSKQNVSFGDDDNRSIVFRHSQGVANCCVDTVSTPAE